MLAVFAGAAGVLLVVAAGVEAACGASLGLLLQAASSRQIEKNPYFERIPIFLTFSFFWACPRAPPRCFAASPLERGEPCAGSGYTLHHAPIRRVVPLLSLTRQTAHKISTYPPNNKKKQFLPSEAPENQGLLAMFAQFAALNTAKFDLLAFLAPTAQKSTHLCAHHNTPNNLCNRKLYTKFLLSLPNTPNRY